MIPKYRLKDSKNTTLKITDTHIIAGMRCCNGFIAWAIENDLKKAIQELNEARCDVRCGEWAIKQMMQIYLRGHFNSLFIENFRNQTIDPSHVYDTHKHTQTFFVFCFVCVGRFLLLFAKKIVFFCCWFFL